MSEYVVKCAEAKDYAPLVYRLRNGTELSQSEREFLADHLKGKRGGRGRGASPRLAWKARRHYRLFYWLTEFEGAQPEHAYDQLAKIHGISRRKAIEHVKLATKSGHAEKVVSDEQNLLMLASEDPESEMQKIYLELRKNRRRAVLDGTHENPSIISK